MAFLGIGAAGNDLAQISVDQDIQAQFPYPVATCAQAKTAIDGLNAAIQSVQNEMLNTACDSGCKRVHGRYVLAYQQQLAKFQQWRVKANCDALEKQAADAANLQLFNEQTQAATAQATQAASQTNQLIVYAVGGMVVLTAALIVLKHKKQQA